MTERRRYVRVPGENQVTITLLSVPGNGSPSRKKIHGFTADISVCGTRLTLATKEPLLVGSVAELEMAVKDPDAVFVHEVDVRWAAPSENGAFACATGVQFRTTRKPSPQTWVHYVENQTLGFVQE